MKHSKDKDICFKMDVTDEVIMDARKQVHIETPLERALIDAVNVLNAEEEKDIKEWLKELDTSK